MRPTLENKARGVLEATALPRIENEPEFADRIIREVAHGVDILKWINLLYPQASSQLKAAGLIHDIDRVVNYGIIPEFKGDRTSKEYQEYKYRHEERSFSIASTLLRELGIGKKSFRKIITLIALHDHPWELIDKHGDPELEVLVSADGFAFFTSIAEEMWRREGEESLRGKIIFMIRKMPPFFRQKLAEIDFTDPQFGINPEFSSILMRIKTRALSEVSQTNP